MAVSNWSLLKGAHDAQQIVACLRGQQDISAPPQKNPRSFSDASLSSETRESRCRTLKISSLRMIAFFGKIKLTKNRGRAYPDCEGCTPGKKEGLLSGMEAEGWGH
jgi:hypothetical protein